MTLIEAIMRNAKMGHSRPTTVMDKAKRVNEYVHQNMECTSRIRTT